MNINSDRWQCPSVPDARRSNRNRERGFCFCNFHPRCPVASRCLLAENQSDRVCLFLIFIFFPLDVPAIPMAFDGSGCKNAHIPIDTPNPTEPGPPHRWIGGSVFPKARFPICRKLCCFQYCYFRNEMCHLRIGRWSYAFSFFSYFCLNV